MPGGPDGHIAAPDAPTLSEVSTVYADIDGNPTPIVECAWIQIAPCGCICSIFSAGGTTDPRPTDPITTEAQLLARYRQPKWRTEQERSLGFVYKLIRRTDDRVGITGHCAHNPQWGVPPRASRTGYRWGTGTRSTRLHLVPITALEAAEVTGRRAESLCGRTGHWASGDVADLPDCAKCTALANP